MATRRVPRLSGGGQGNLIYAQVNGGVGSGSPTFLFDNAIAFVGRAPTGGTGTAQNNYAETLADNAWVWLAQRRDNDQWYLDRAAAGSSGSQVVYFTLSENKSLADDDALADVGGSTIYVVDEDNRYVGKTGYKGTAFKFEDDHASSGHPGYRIIEMETPAAWLVVELYEDVSGGTAQCTLLDPGVYGLPHSGKDPVLVDGKLDVYDDLEDEPAKDGVTGQVWIARYDAQSDYYVFWRPFEWSMVSGVTTGAVTPSSATFTINTIDVVQGFLPYGTTLTVQNEAITDKGVSGSGLAFDSGDTVVAIWDQRDKKWRLFPGGGFHVIKGLATSSVTGSTSTFSIDNIEVVQGRKPAGSTITVKNDPPIEAANDGVVYARWDMSEDAWTTADAGNFDGLEKAWLRDQSGYSGAAARQYFAHETGTFIWKTPSEC